MDSIEKVRKTNAGRLPLVLCRKIGERMEPPNNHLTEVLKEDAEVICKRQELWVEIREIEETATKAEVREALQKIVGDCYTIVLEAIKSVRKAFRETQIATVRLLPEVVVIGGRGKIRIGLVNCSIREIARRPLKCFKPVKCALYIEKGKDEGRDHVAGSYKCPVFREDSNRLSQRK